MSQTPAAPAAGTVPLKALSICSICPKMGLFQWKRNVQLGKGKEKVVTPLPHDGIVMGKSGVMQ